MRQKLKKANKENQKNTSSDCNSGVSSKKKISLGKIVEKTVEILKKPFSKPKAVDGLAEDKCDKKKLQKRKQHSTSQSSKSKPNKKKESIIVDYPSTSLKKLEKDKDAKIAKRKLQKKRNPLKKEIEKISDEYQEDDDQLEEAAERQREASSQISTEVNGFFYTNDKFITRFEDDDILDYLKVHYPLFMKNPLDFQTQKKQILEMLQNAQFMDDLLNYYDMNIYEFFKFLFRLEPDLFRGSFLKRVQKAMRYKKYAIKAKRCSYAERKRASIKKSKQNESSSRKFSTNSTDEVITIKYWKKGSAHFPH